jgi:hypothetical protein
MSRKMSQTETQPATRKSFSTRSLILVILLAGLSAGTAAYVLANASAAPTTPSTQNGLNTYNGQWSGLRGAGPLGWERHDNATFTSFRAASTVTNVTVTGFNIVDSSHLTVTLSYQGTGTTPAVTTVAAAPGLSGSNTVSAGWSSPTTVSVHVIGSGSLSSTETSLGDQLLLNQNSIFFLGDVLSQQSKPLRIVFCSRQRLYDRQAASDV